MCRLRPATARKRQQRQNSLSQKGWKTHWNLKVLHRVRNSGEKKVCYLKVNPPLMVWPLPGSNWQGEGSFEGGRASTSWVAEASGHGSVAVWWRKTAAEFAWAALPGERTPGRELQEFENRGWEVGVSQVQEGRAGP